MLCAYNLFRHGIRDKYEKCKDKSLTHSGTLSITNFVTLYHLYPLTLYLTRSFTLAFSLTQNISHHLSQTTSLFLCTYVCGRERPPFRRSAHVSNSCRQCTYNHLPRWFERSGTWRVPETWHRSVASLLAQVSLDQSRNVTFCPTATKSIRNRDGCVDLLYDLWLYASSCQIILTYQGNI